MMTHGIQIFNPDGTPQYDSRKRKLTVDPFQDPTHLDIFETSGGTGWTVPGNTTRTEVLWEMEHNMPFPPLYTFYIEEIVNPYGNEGWFSQNIAYIGGAPNISNPIPFFGLELIHFILSEDQSKIQLEHRAQNVGSSNATAAGNQYLYRIKYMIFNQEAILF